MPQYKILIIDSVHHNLIDQLHNHNFICQYSPEIDIEEIQSTIDKFDGLILRSKIIIDKYFLSNASKLKFIGRVGAGMENIDLITAEKLGITCFNSPEGNRDAVGEHALGMLLAMSNNLFKANQEVKKGIWNREGNRGFELKGKTIGIIGYGNMGSSFARKLAGFETTVIAYDKYKFNYNDTFVIEKNLEELFETTDILSLHIPLTDETHYMIDDEFINRFKKDIYMINTARGKVVKTSDLVKNLRSGKIKGAMLDVLEYEQSSFEGILHDEKSEELNYLLSNDKVLLSPHIAGWTVESKIKLCGIIGNKIIRNFG